MTARGLGLSSDFYSPKRRTALVLTGTGTAGAYHAGVLRALHEAGIKIDVAAGRGVGVVGAVFCAIDGAQRLWEDGGFWQGTAVRRFYAWRPLLKLAFWALALSVALVFVPITAVAFGLIVFPIDFVLKLVGASGGGLSAAYEAVVSRAFASEELPTWLPRLVLLVLGATALVAAAAAWMDRGERRTRGPVWWRLFRPPLVAGVAVDRCWSMLWGLIRGASHLGQPSPADIGRRYTEMLAENLGQPGCCELVLAVHDLDARLDLLFTLVGEGRRRSLLKRAKSDETEARRAELLDLSGVAREHLGDAVAGALAIALATEPHVIRFEADSYWRGESHRICDRQGSLVRLIEELIGQSVEQIILVSAAPEGPGPHALTARRLDPRARLGEFLLSAEAATLRDVMHFSGAGAAQIFSIRPAHNPIGPFDFGGGFDDLSDRHQSLGELISRGYEDAYKQFIEPVVGGSGEQI